MCCRPASESYNAVNVAIWNVLVEPRKFGTGTGYDVGWPIKREHRKMGKRLLITARRKQYDFLIPPPSLDYPLHEHRWGVGWL